jgi:hypothetical protein
MQVHKAARRILARTGHRSGQWPVVLVQGVLPGVGGGLPQTRTKSRLEIGKRKENTTKN